MTPGPTRVPERVLGAGARPMLHHRSPEFSAELATVLALLPPLFGTSGVVLPVHATGRGALEAAVCNLFSAGDEIAVCCNGRFGEMWARLAESHGVVVQRVATDWDRDVDPLEIAALLERRPAIRGVALAYSDTSTGVRNDVEAVARVVGGRSALLMVDGVSAIGGMPFAFDEWGVDVAVTASQKCLMSSPGLSFVAVSERAWAAQARARLPRSYWDFLEIRRALSKARPETPGTPPVHIVLQVAEALRMIHEEKIENVYRRHEAMSARVRGAAAELGLSMQCPALQRYSSTVTAIASPAAISPGAVRDHLRAGGIFTSAALGPYERTAFRIGHMGDIRLPDVELTLAALAGALADLASPGRAGSR